MHEISSSQAIPRIEKKEDFILQWSHVRYRDRTNSVIEIRVKKMIHLIRDYLKRIQLHHMLEYCTSTFLLSEHPPSRVAQFSRGLLRMCYLA